ncbi:MAG: hypothetical protein M3N28_05125 [Actinomycetota bacterium]|nr:hypothetical protein [Actinomycetota bacterium]
MARKRRSARTAVRFSPSDFLISDGWTYSDLDGVELLESLREAQAAWEACRVKTWDEWLETHGSPLCWPGHPPRGALHHDDLTERTWSLREGNTVAEAIEAVALDLAAVEDFRRRRPDAARSVAEGLLVLCEDLTTYASLVEAYGDDYKAREHTFFKLRAGVR